MLHSPSDGNAVLAGHGDDTATIVFKNGLQPKENRNERILASKLYSFHTIVIYVNKDVHQTRNRTPWYPDLSGRDGGNAELGEGKALLLQRNACATVR